MDSLFGPSGFRLVVLFGFRGLWAERTTESWGCPEDGLCAYMGVFTRLGPASLDWKGSNGKSCFGMGAYCQSHFKRWSSHATEVAREGKAIIYLMSGLVRKAVSRGRPPASCSLHSLRWCLPVLPAKSHNDQSTEGTVSSIRQAVLESP